MDLASRRQFSQDVKILIQELEFMQEVLNHMIPSKAFSTQSSRSITSMTSPEDT